MHASYTHTSYIYGYPSLIPIKVAIAVNYLCQVYYTLIEQSHYCQAIKELYVATMYMYIYNSTKRPGLHNE